MAKDTPVIDELPAVEELMLAAARVESPYAVLCWRCGKVLLTEAEYDEQMARPDNRWRCPRCGTEAEWDDAHYDAAQEADDDPDDEFAEYDRERVEIEAWRKLVEMRGGLHDFAREDGGRSWSCTAPDGSSDARDGWPRLLTEYREDPLEAVEACWEQWVRAGRPAWPVRVDVEVGDEDPSATERQRRPDEVPDA